MAHDLYDPDLVYLFEQCLKTTRRLYPYPTTLFRAARPISLSCIPSACTRPARCPSSHLEYAPWNAS